MEHEENNIMECSLFCESVSRTFLDQMCNGWNVSSACPPDVKTVEMTTYTNMSKALYQQNCLYFPVDMVFVDDQKIEHPTCSNVSTSTNCSVVCNSKTIMSYITKTVPDGSENEPFYTTVQFQTLFGLMIGAWACQAVVSSLADSICFTLLGTRNKIIIYILFFTVIMALYFVILRKQTTRLRRPKVMGSSWMGNFCYYCRLSNRHRLFWENGKRLYTELLSSLYYFDPKYTCCFAY